MPLKVKVTPPREGGGRVMSATDASKSKSTPPKTGKDASFQRVVNSMTSFLKNNDPKSLTSAIKEAKEKAKGLKGPKVAPKEYQRPPSGKAYGGKTKMMAGGRAKKK